MCVCGCVYVCGCHMGVFLSSMFTNDALCLNKCKLITLAKYIGFTFKDDFKMAARLLYARRRLPPALYRVPDLCALMTE